MRSRRIPMTVEEFELLPMVLGWKYEYYDGKAHIRPGHTIAVVRMEVEPRKVSAPRPLLGVTMEDERQLIQAFFDAFRDTVEYCDWERRKIEQSARKSIKTFFAGRRGHPHTSSRLALTEESPPVVAGAALIVTNANGPMLDILFVSPQYQRAGLATALVADAMNELHRQGEKSLRSAYHIGNEASRRWHARFGFVEEPDLLLARTYLHCARRELWRREKMGGLNDQERKALEADCERWEARVEELEEIADREGYEAVSPILNLHRL